MSHFGIPGPGGSMGKCAICGDGFLTDIVMGNEIESFSIGFVEQILYAHSPACIDTLKTAIDTDNPTVVRARLPDGPLRDCLTDALIALNECPDCKTALRVTSKGAKYCPDENCAWAEWLKHPELYQNDEAVIRRFRTITLAPGALEDVPVVALVAFLHEHGLAMGQDLVIRRDE